MVIYLESDNMEGEKVYAVFNIVLNSIKTNNMSDEDVENSIESMIDDAVDEVNEEYNEDFSYKMINDNTFNFGYVDRLEMEVLTEISEILDRMSFINDGVIDDVYVKYFSCTKV